MHRARMVGVGFLLVGVVATALLVWMPVWVPIPRVVAIPGPVLGMLGLAMMVHPGPVPPGGEFDFEDWFDECTWREKGLYLLAALLGLGLAGYLYVTQGWMAEAVNEFEGQIDGQIDGQFEGKFEAG